MNGCNLAVAGVGGQGILLFSRVLAEAAFRSGYKVVVGQSFTAAQRYGSVVAFVRFGKEVYSPLISTGQVDIIVGFEPLEALRYIQLLSPNGIVLLNINEIHPVSVMLNMERYPEIHEIENAIKQMHGKVLKLDATQLARSLGDEKVTNMIMLGALSNIKRLRISSSAFIESIKNNVHYSMLNKNIEAFRVGKQLRLS